MKKIRLLIAVLGLSGLVGFGLMKTSPIKAAYAEPEQSDPAPVDEPEPEDLSATVVLEKIEHGTIEATIMEGVEGDICTLNVKAELFYLVNSVSVNGTVLIEDENISGLYSFALVKGVNTVTTKIVVNTELLGELSSIYDQARNKDWTNLFTVENVIHLIKWVLDCGILVAIVRYYIRDKKLADKVEKSIKGELDKILPQATKDTVVATVESVLAPAFSQIKADNTEIMRALGIFSQCFALMQQNTPESRVAILEMLSNLNISDEKTLAEVKAYIDKLFKDHMNTYNEIMDKLNTISEENKEIAGIEEETPVGDVDDSNEEPNEPEIPDGTSI